MQSEFALTPANAIVKYKRCIEACHFISLDVAMSCCTIYFKCMMFILFVL